MHDIHFLEILMCVILNVVLIVCVFVFIFYPLLIIYHVDAVKCISRLSFLYGLVWLICGSSLRWDSGVVPRWFPLRRSGELFFQLCHYASFKNVVESWLLFNRVVRLWYCDIEVGFNKVSYLLSYYISRLVVKSYFSNPYSTQLINRTPPRLTNNTNHIKIRVNYIFIRCKYWQFCF